MFDKLVDYNWEILEKQPLYVKGVRKESKNHGYSMELAIDRHGSEELAGEVFRVYGSDIPDIPVNSDVKIKVNKEKAWFMLKPAGYGNAVEKMPFVHVLSVSKVDKA